ncbi:MAG: hypothetical protein ABIT71_14150 [Vicinamibacteraceae bacterium]
MPGLRRLQDAHALQLHPLGCRPWVVHPFALAPGSCWVQTPRIGYWAQCLSGTRAPHARVLQRI